jgi:hypothetical protein
LPAWSDAREFSYSVLQQFLNPIGTEIERLYKHAADGNANHSLSVANLDLLDVVYTVQLPASYEFGTDITNPGSPMYVAPRVEAVATDSSNVTVALATDNSLQAWHYASLPTRVEDAQESSNVTSVLDETTLANLSSATINAVEHPNRLTVTVSDCTSFIDITRRSPNAFIRITGTTDRDLEETEIFLVPYNGIFQTHKIWKEVDEVDYFGLEPSTGKIQIDNFAFNISREPDKNNLSVDSTAEKILYHRLASKSYGTTHEHASVTANTLLDLYGGWSSLATTKEIELGYDNSGTFTNVTLDDMAIQPFTGRIFAIDSSYLYIFDSFDSLADCRGMALRTPGAAMIIDTDSVDHVRDDAITFRPRWRRPTERVYRNRWTIEKPDGTKVRLYIDGSEVALTNAAWIYNKIYTELQFGPFDRGGSEVSKQEFTYTLTQRGTYKITLEVEYTNGTTEIDVLPVQVHYKEALARLALPYALTGPSGIAFDADQNLWLLYEASGNTAKKVHLAKDNMIIDFKNKILYLHENYSRVTVWPSEDWEG